MFDVSQMQPFASHPPWEMPASPHSTCPEGIEGRKRQRNVCPESYTQPLRSHSGHSMPSSPHWTTFLGSPGIVAVSQDFISHAQNGPEQRAGGEVGGGEGGEGGSHRRWPAWASPHVSPEQQVPGMSKGSLAHASPRAPHDGSQLCCRKPSGVSLRSPQCSEQQFRGASGEHAFPSGAQLCSARCFTCTSSASTESRAIVIGDNGAED